MGNSIACISQPTAAAFASAANVPLTTYTSGTPGFNSGGICLSYCSTTEYAGAQLLYQNPSAPQTVTGVECYCFPNELAPTNLVASQGIDGNCFAGDVKVLKKTTTFGSLTCGANVAAAGLSSITNVPTIPACFFQCRGTSQANIMYAAGASTFQCFCGPLANALPATCQAGTTYSFTHRNFPASSGMARRAVQDRKSAARRARLGKGGDMEYCPAGLSACMVASKAGSGYECIDTSSELESCGGCAYGLYAGPGRRPRKSISVDCTKMSGVPLGGGTCVKGECVAMACEEGFGLDQGTCVEVP